MYDFVVVLFNVAFIELTTRDGEMTEAIQGQLHQNKKEMRLPWKLENTFFLCLQKAFANPKKKNKKKKKTKPTKTQAVLSPGKLTCTMA